MFSMASLRALINGSVLRGRFKLRLNQLESAKIDSFDAVLLSASRRVFSFLHRSFDDMVPSIRMASGGGGCRLFWNVMSFFSSPARSCFTFLFLAGSASSSKLVHKTGSYASNRIIREPFPPKTPWCLVPHWQSPSRSPAEKYPSLLP